MDSQKEKGHHAAMGTRLLNTATVEDDRIFAEFMRNSFSRWFQKLNQANPCLPSHFASGPALEGGWSADTCDNGILLGIEIYQPFVFLRDFSDIDIERRLVEETKTGIVNVKLLNVDLSDGHSLRELAIMDSTDGEWYLAPKNCLELSAYHRKMSEGHQIYSHLHDSQMFIETMLITIYNEEDRDGVLGFDFQIWEDSPKVNAEIKTIPCISCSGWPSVADGWPRKTEWPGEKDATVIKKGGFHLVSESPDLVDLPFSWKISFAKAELELMKSLVSNQRNCYIGLKKFLAGVSSLDSNVANCLLKTVLFWDAEEYGPDNDIWSEQLDSCMERLMTKIKSSIEKGMCVHYFIPDVNILDSLTGEQRRNIVAEFDEALINIGTMSCGAINGGAVTKVVNLVDSYPKMASKKSSLDEPTDLNAALEDGSNMTSIFTVEFLESTYEKYIRVNMSTTKKDKARAAQYRSKFYHGLVALYVLALAVNYAVIPVSTHASLMMFLTFLVAGLLLNLGWSYRWALCFLYSVMSLDSDWCLSSKVAHFVLAFPLAKFVSQMMALFERPLENPKFQASRRDSPGMVLNGTVAKPGLVAPMLFLYGVNLLLMCGSKSQGLRNYWDVVVCTLANHGHFIVFCPWMELFYRDYNRLVVRLKPAICSTVCTSLFVMFMLHYSDYNKAFWPWFVMTCLTIALCCFMCYSLPNHFAIPIYCLFSLMLFLPARILYTVMVILYAAYWSFLPWHSMPFTRALRVLTLLCVHLCLQTTSLTDILASVNMVFGCCMYIGCLYSFYSAEVSQKNVSLLRRITCTLMLGTFVGGVALLALQSKPASTQEAFIQVSAPVSAAMMLHSLEGTLLHTIYKLWKRLRARDGGIANHT